MNLKLFRYFSSIVFLGAGLLIFSSYFLDKSLWIDEGYSVITAFQILDRGFPLFQSGYWDGSYMFFHYIQALCLGMFGFSEWSVRLPGLLLSLLNGYLIFRISSDIFGKWSGIATLITVTISYNYWAYGLQARYYAMLMFFVLLWIYYLWIFLGDSTRKNLWILFLISLLGFLFHIFLGVSFVLTIGAIALRARGFLTKRDILFIGGLALVFGLIRGSVFSSFWGSSLGIDWSFGNHFGYVLRYQVFFIEKFHFLYSSLFLLFPLYLFLQKEQRVFTSILLIFFSVSLLAISYFVPFYADRYVYHLTVFLYIFTPGVFLYVGNMLISRYEKSIYHIVWIILLGTSGFTIFPLGNSFSMNDVFSPEPDFRGAYSYIKNTYGTDYRVVSAYPHMDMLYLDKSDGYLYIDETGIGIPPEKNFYIKNNASIFTESSLISTVNDLQNLKYKNSIILMDGLSYNRIRNTNPKLMQYIESTYKMEYEINSSNYFIRVYTTI